MYAINPELCTFCKSCMEECPTGAIQLTARKSALSLPSASTAAAARIPAPPIPRLSAIRTNIGFHQERENTGVPATARPIFVSPDNKTTGEGIEHATLQNDHCGG